jgi:hypothetical protein
MANAKARTAAIPAMAARIFARRLLGRVNVNVLKWILMPMVVKDGQGMDVDAYWEMN